jgi:flagellar biosynthetic protein FliR
MTNILLFDFVTVILIFIRVFTAFTLSPVLGHRSLPVIFQISLSFIVAYMIFLSSGMKTVSGEISLWFLFINGAKEAITGMILGYSMHIVFWGITYAGSLIGMDIGLSMAEAFNPMEEINTNVIGEIIYTAAILIFFIIDGHHYFIQALASSFSLIPIGKFTINSSVYELLVKYTGGVFIIAVKIASPIMVSFFLVHIAEGIIARVIPQMQVFFVTQPVKVILGFSMLIALVPIYVFVIKNMLKGYEDSLFTLIKSMGA